MLASTAMLNAMTQPRPAITSCTKKDAKMMAPQMGLFIKAG